MKKVAVFGSGNGSNFEAIIKYFQDNKNIEFFCVSDKKDSFILERAKNLGIKNFYVPFEETYNFLKKYKFDLVVLAGYMRILPEEIVNLANIINIHPSLLPAFKGNDAIRQAYEAKETVTGVTVHYVDKEVDSGEIIAQVPVLIKDNMSLSDLEQEIHKAEHKLYPAIIEKLIFNYSFCD